MQQGVGRARARSARSPDRLVGRSVAGAVVGVEEAIGERLALLDLHLVDLLCASTAATVLADEVIQLHHEAQKAGIVHDRSRYADQGMFLDCF